MAIKRIILDTTSAAMAAKQWFGDDYDMYCGYVAQWQNDTSRLVPISEEQYNALEV